MVGVAPDEGGRRRLPPWMLGVTAADQVTMSGDGDRGNHHQQEEVAFLTCSGKAKAASRQPKTTILPCQEESSRANSCCQKQRETKRRKRISSLEDLKCDDNIPETVPQKMYHGLVRKVRDTAPRKRQKLRTAIPEIAKELDISSDDVDCDAELTTEDLLSIAEEYVKADKDKRCLQLSNGESESERQHPSSSSRNESGSILSADGSIKTSPTRETTATATANLTRAQLLKSSKTGDPAEDMLDLFFGSLLRKPVEKEKKTVLNANNVAFDCEIKMLSQSNVAGEETVPRMMDKKKSSLKDKVAMLLD